MLRSPRLLEPRASRSDHDQFTGIPTPAITAVAGAGDSTNSSTGTFAGGTTASAFEVLISGSTLSGATAVYFGTTQGTIVEDADLYLVAMSPAGKAGTVDITVVSANGTCDDNERQVCSMSPRQLRRDHLHRHIRMPRFRFRRRACLPSTAIRKSFRSALHCFPNLPTERLPSPATVRSPTRPTLAFWAPTALVIKQAMAFSLRMRPRLQST